LRTPPAKQMSQGPDPGAGAPVSMGDSAAGASGVEAVDSVSMGVNATNAKSVVEKESVSMDGYAATAKSVVAVASVSMDDNATNAKSVVEKESVTTDDDAARTARSAVAVRSGSEMNQTVTMILQNRKRVSLHRLGS
jgi:hypothetical protein